MGDAGAEKDEHAHGRLWPRRDARRGGDDDARSLPVAARVVVYHAPGCHLCERALETLAAVSRDVPFELEEVDIEGDPALEAAYREWLPVVEIDGERAFVYFVDEEGLRRRLTRTKFATNL